MRNRLKGVLIVMIVLSVCVSGLEEEKKTTLTPQQFLENFKQKKFMGEELDFDLKNADIKKVIDFISRVSGFTFEVEPEVEGAVTLKEYMVPWDKAFYLFLEQNSLEIILEEEKFIVRKKELEEKEEKEE